MQNQPIDQQALNLTHAIALQESGIDGKPDYSAVGDAGTSKGAYQWQPGNFESAAKNAGLDPTDFSPENQDKVAYSQVKSYKDKGLDPGQIASMWNSGSPDNWQNHSGTTTINGKQISYDTPKYVQGVKKYYQQLSGESSEQSDTPERQTFQQALGTQNPQPTPTSTDTTAPGNMISNFSKGDIGGGIESGIRDLGNALTFGGTEQFAKPLGTSMAYFGEKAKGLLGGQDNSKYIPETNNADTFAGAGKIMSGASLGLLGGGATPLESPTILQSLPKGMTPQTFLGLGKVEQQNLLGDLLKSADKAGMVGDVGEISKALKYLQPSKSFIRSLVKGGLEVGSYELLKKIFGGTVGGLIHKATGL